MICNGRRSVPALAACACLVTALALGACTAQSPERLPERLVMPFDSREWVVVYEDPDSPGAIVQYVPTDQAIDEWQEMITRRTYEGLQKTTTVQEALEADRQRIDEECKDTTWKLIETTAVDVVYEVTRRSCAEKEPAYEIGRLFAGDQALYQVTYTADVDSVSESERDEWIGILTGVVLVHR